jgi:hypothetical protein
MRSETGPPVAVSKKPPPGLTTVTASYAAQSGKWRRPDANDRGARLIRGFRQWPAGTVASPSQNAPVLPEYPRGQSPDLKSKLRKKRPPSGGLFV